MLLIPKVAFSVVKLPAAGVVPPIAGGVAKFRLPESHGVLPLKTGRTDIVCCAAQVFVPFSNGMVAPDVPVLTVAAVPKPRFVREVEALATSERLLALVSALASVAAAFDALVAAALAEPAAAVALLPAAVAELAAALALLAALVADVPALDAEPAAAVALPLAAVAELAAALADPPAALALAAADEAELDAPVALPCAAAAEAAAAAASAAVAATEVSMNAPKTACSPETPLPSVSVSLSAIFTPLGFGRCASNPGPTQAWYYLQKLSVRRVARFQPATAPCWGTSD